MRGAGSLLSHAPGLEGSLWRGCDITRIVLGQWVQGLRPPTYSVSLLSSPEETSVCTKTFHLLEVI